MAISCGGIGAGLWQPNAAWLCSALEGDGGLMGAERPRPAFGRKKLSAG